MDVDINIDTNNIKIDCIMLQKMIFLYNALDKGWTVKKKKNAYIYGTLRKTGWKPSTQKAFRGGLITKPRLAKRGY